jgi:hypothetical protein
MRTISNVVPLHVDRHQTISSQVVAALRELKPGATFTSQDLLPNTTNFGAVAATLCRCARNGVVEIVGKMGKTFVYKLIDPDVNIKVRPMIKDDLVRPRGTGAGRFVKRAAPPVIDNYQAIHDKIQALSNALVEIAVEVENLSAMLPTVK